MFVILKPKTTEFTASGMTPANVAAAIGDNSTNAPNAQGTSKALTFDTSGNPNWAEITRGAMQSLEDVGAPDLPIIGAGSQINTQLSSQQMNVVQLYDSRKPRQPDFELVAKGLSQIEFEPRPGTANTYNATVPGITGTCTLRKNEMVFWKDRSDPSYNNPYTSENFLLTRDLFANLKWALCWKNFGPATTTTTSTTWDGTYDVGSWQYQSSFCGENTDPGPFYSSYVGSYPTSMDQGTGEQCVVNSTIGQMFDHYTRSVSKHYVTTTTTVPVQPSSLTTYFYNLIVELAEAPTASSGLSPANGATVTTGRPTLGLTTGQPPSSQVVGAQWQVATDSAFTQDLITVSEPSASWTNASRAVTFKLSDAQRLTKEGIWYLRGRTIDAYGQFGPWTNVNSFTVDIASPGAPTGLAPTDGSTINTAVPFLQAQLTPTADLQPLKLEWQLATDAGFTANVKSVLQPDSEFRTSGLVTYKTPIASKLSQTVWYIRARQIDVYGQASAWTAANSFTVSHSPNPSNLLPTSAKTIAFSATTKLSWNFSDTSEVDTQTAYQVIIEKNSDGSLVVDTGKVSTSSTFYNADLSAFKDVQLRWKVRLWDTDDVPGAYSSYSLFTVSDPPDLAIVDPTDGSTVSSTRPTVSWTFAASAGRTMASWRVIFTKLGTQSVVVFDTGVKTGSALSFVPNLPVVENQNSYTIQVIVTDNVGLSSTQTVSVDADYATPSLVSFSVDGTSYASLGYVAVGWQMTADSSFLRWRVYRRNVSIGEDFAIIGEIADRYVNSYNDWMAPSQQTYEYKVVQIVESFGEEIESAAIPLAVVIGAGDYWLIDPLDETNNIKLFLVKEDNYTFDVEQSDYIVVGRGRHVDYGEIIGISGSITAQVRDSVDSTARQKKQALIDLKKQRKPVYLRNPFGDILHIALGSVGISRIQGTGPAEFCDVTVPYMEIF